MIKKIKLAALSLLLVQNSLFAVESLQTKTPELAADFTLLDLENKEVSLTDFKDKPVVLFFWATWCPFCRDELKNLNDIYPELVKNGVEVLAINVGETAEKVERFTKNHPLLYRVLLDKDTEVARVYAIVGIPTYIFIDKKVRIVFSNHYFSQQDYQGLIAEK